jgi:hypothetical protein
MDQELAIVAAGVLLGLGEVCYKYKVVGVIRRIDVAM